MGCPAHATAGSAQPSAHLLGVLLVLLAERPQLRSTSCRRGAYTSCAAPRAPGLARAPGPRAHAPDEVGSEPRHRRFDVPVARVQVAARELAARWRAGRPPQGVLSLSTLAAPSGAGRGWCGARRPGAPPFYWRRVRVLVERLRGGGGRLRVSGMRGRANQTVMGCCAISGVHEIARRAAGSQCCFLRSLDVCFPNSSALAFHAHSTLALVCAASCTSRRSGAARSWRSCAARLEITENRVVARSHPPRPHPDGRRTRRDGRRALEAELRRTSRSSRLLRENQSPRAGRAASHH